MSRTSTSYMGTLYLGDPNTNLAIELCRDTARGINRQLRALGQSWKVSVQLRGRAGRNRMNRTYWQQEALAKRYRRGAGPQSVPLSCAERVDVYLYLKNDYDAERACFSSRAVNVKVHPRIRKYMEDTIRRAA